MTPTQLAELEDDVAHALESEDRSQPSSIGHGEISVALGYPAAMCDAKPFPRLKKLQQIEPAWCTRVRHQRYDFFVQETTYS